MTARDYLIEIQDLNNKIKHIKNQIDYFDRMSYSLGGNGYGEEVVSRTRSFKAPFEKWIYKKIEAEASLKEAYKELAEKIDIIQPVLERVDSFDEGLILNYRYIMDMNWNDIAEKMSYSLTSIYRHHRRALEKMDEISM